MFQQEVDINDESILFKSIEGISEIHREEFEDIWSQIRIKGAIRDKDIPERIIKERITKRLFDILQDLEYLKPVTLSTIADGKSFLGLRYDPPPVSDSITEEELVI